MCGKPGANKIAKIAGAEMTVCDSCAGRGEIVEEVREPTRRERIIEQRREEPTIERAPKVEEVLEDIGESVRTKREELGLKQEDLAKRINEPASIIKRIEHGFIPNLKVAHKLQRELHVKLTEVVEGSEQEYATGRSGGEMTLGDVIVIKKSK